MPLTIRAYRRFLPLVYCSGIWSLITLLWLSVGPVHAEWVDVGGKVEAGLTVYNCIRGARHHSPQGGRGEVVGIVRLQDNTNHRGGPVVV
jgi:hypothetical protein